MKNTEKNAPIKIFLSYASEDRERVLELHRKLKNDGFRPWTDVEMLLPGQNWDLEINKAIKSSDVVIFCLTDVSVNKRGYVQREMKKAIDLSQEQLDDDIFIIPARLDKCNVPESLLKWHYVDLFTEDGYQRLLRALELKTSQRSTNTAEKATNSIQQSLHKRKLIQLHAIAQQLYDQAYLALQENQDTLTPALQGLEAPKVAIQKMISVFHRQRSRGFFSKHEAYLSEALQRYDPNDPNDAMVRQITNDLLETVKDLIDIFYSYAEEHDGKLITKSNILRKEMFLNMDATKDLTFFGKYLEGIRIRVENISWIVGKLSAMIE